MRLECDSILFDLDGVLVDSAACVERNWRLWASENGLDPAAIVRVAHGQKTVETMRRFAPDLDVEEEARRFAEREANDMEGVFPVPGASALVKRLPGEMWAVVTSGTTNLALARLHHVGLPVPRVLVTADDVPRGKPAPDPYLLAARRMGVAPAACVVVEDSPPGIASARSAGMRVIGLATTHKREDLVGCDAVVDGLESLRMAVYARAKVRIIVELAR